jgi:hypothetical protein
MKSDGFITHATFTDSDEDDHDDTLFIEDIGPLGFAPTSGGDALISVSGMGGISSFNRDQAEQLIEAMQTILGRYSDE